jgi:hypothetical protein
MEFTHDIEIHINGMELVMEVCFEGNEPTVKISNPMEMTMRQYSQLKEFVDAVITFEKQFSELTSIEIMKK